MTALTDLLAPRAKAFAGAVATAVAVYVAVAVQAGTAITLHGVEGAAAGAVLAFLGVHQTPNRKRPAGHPYPTGGGGNVVSSLGPAQGARIADGLSYSPEQVMRFERFRASSPDWLTLLPEPSGRKHGALPSPVDHRDYQAVLPSKIPSHVDNGAGLTFGMLLNDRIGDCYPAALLHALQVLSGGTYVPTDADALYVYEQVTGYDPTRTAPDGSNPTDQGTYGRRLFEWAKARGLITRYAAVPTDRQSIKAAIAGHQVVLCEWALPAGAEREGAHWTMPRAGRAAGSWGYHATCEVGFTTERKKNVTWGVEDTVTDAFEDAYLQAAWVVTVPETLPPVQP